MVAISSLAAGEELWEQMAMAEQPIMTGVGAVIEDEAYFFNGKATAVFIWYN